jgi:hypothetical protein
VNSVVYTTETNARVEAQSESAAQAVGAPDDEIEVTSEMIDAGLIAWYDVDTRFDSAEFAMKAAFIAMWKAHKNNSNNKISAVSNMNVKGSK